MSAVLVNNINKKYGQRQVLTDINMENKQGQITAIIGPSGSGKTTLLRIINGLEKPDTGTVKIHDKIMKYENGSDLDLRRKMVLVTQSPVAFRDTVFENVAYPLKIREVEDMEKKVLAAMKTVDMEEFAQENAKTLSGGELQRMCFARAIVHEPELLLLDEFTNHLDPVNVRMLESAVTEYVEKQNASVIIVTHNLYQARRISNETALLLDGQIVEKELTENLFQEPKDERTKAFVRGDMVF